MIQEKDFIELEYTGKADGIIFDSTQKEIAEKNGLPESGSAVICVGKGQILPGLDEHLVNKEIGKEYTVALQPEKAFGKKSAKLIQLVQTSKFSKNKIIPQPGLHVSIDGMNGIVKTVSGGRTLVDFNHPLSGMVVEYTYKILRKVENDEEKLKGIIKQNFDHEVKAAITDGKAIVELDIPKEMADEMNKKIKELIPSIKDVAWEKQKAQATQENKF